MNPWPKHPVIYEINTWVWLQELSQEYKSPVTLAKVPREKWDAIADLKVDAVWFMGVWERSPAGIAIANQNKGLLEDFRRALPDFRPEDNVGSPYCVRQIRGGRTSGRSGKALRLRGENSPSGGSSLSSISSRTTWRRTIHGSSSIPNTSFRGTPTMRRTIRRPSLRREERCLPAAGTPTFLHGRMCCS